MKIYKLINFFKLQKYFAYFNQQKTEYRRQTARSQNVFEFAMLSQKTEKVKQNG